MSSRPRGDRIRRQSVRNYAPMSPPQRCRCAHHNVDTRHQRRKSMPE
ncbi:hypothetical protein HMPREF1138_0194 [Actinomyces sp. ICM58]|nr:hypothetical protein HMPREF1138_0194 [Actinomyces sp. ICM58]